MAVLHVICKRTLGQVSPAHNMARPRTELLQDLLGLDNLQSKPKILNRDLDTNSSPITKSPHGTQPHNSGENQEEHCVHHIRFFNVPSGPTVPGGTMDCGIGMGEAAHGTVPQ